MIYFKVLPQFGDAQILKTRKNRLVIDRFLVANELYTPGELNRLLRGATLRGCGIKSDTIVFEKIETPKTKTYCFFGARFEKGV